MSAAWTSFEQLLEQGVIGVEYISDFDRVCSVAGEEPINVWCLDLTCSKFASRGASSLCDGSPSLLVGWPPQWCSRSPRRAGFA